MFLAATETSNITGAMFNGLFSTGTGVKFECSSGTCLWEPFESLGLCSSCEDVTTETRLVPNEFWDPRNSSSHAVNVLTYFTYETPAGLAVDEKCFFSREYTVYAGVWNATVLPSPSLQADGTIATVTAMKFDTDSEDVSECGSVLVSAYDCKLSWCAKSYGITKVQNGIISNAAPIVSPLSFLTNENTFYDWFVDGVAIMPGFKAGKVPSKPSPHNVSQCITIC